MKTGQTIPTGARRHWVDVYNAGPPVADGDGGWTTPLVPAGPWAVNLRPANARDLERVAAGTLISLASHIVTGRYHPAVTTKTQLVLRGRTLEVTGVVTTAELNVETIAVCVEVVA